MNITEDAYNIFRERVSDHYPKADTSDVDILNWTVAGTVGLGFGIPAIIKAALKSNDLYNIAFASTLLGFVPARPRVKSFWTTKDKAIRNAEIEEPTAYIAKFLVRESSKELGCFNCFCEDAKITLNEIRNYLKKSEYFNQELATYGVSQKWLNVSIKHFYTICRMSDDQSINAVCDSRLFECAGFPIDNLIKKPINTDLGINYDDYFLKPDGTALPWSQIEDVDSIIAYEKAVLVKLRELNMNSLFEFEYTNWRKDK